MYLLCAVILASCVLVNAQSKAIGDICTLPDNKLGICESFKYCPNANIAINQKNRPEICGFEGKYPIICCQKDSPTIPQPGDRSKEFCSEIYSLKAPKIEAKKQNVIFAVYGGWNSLVAQFPHMAALGFGKDNNIQWLCGGSLISYKHVLTAAHCLNSRDLGNVKYVRLGDLNLKIDTDLAQPQNFTVVKRIKHPEYKQPSKYHDIAIIELDRAVTISEYVKPACLQVERKIYTNNYIASGWGKLDFTGTTADHLQQVFLNEFTNEKCRQFYKGYVGRPLINGIVEDLQLCAGKDNADTCQGDSGGPLQVKNEKHIDGHTIIGVTSFGKACGISNSPGVYTRVSNYIGWIESIVWSI